MERDFSSSFKRFQSLSAFPLRYIWFNALRLCTWTEQLSHVISICLFPWEMIKYSLRKGTGLELLRWPPHNNLANLALIVRKTCVKSKNQIHFQSNDSFQSSAQDFCIWLQGQQLTEQAPLHGFLSLHLCLTFSCKESSKETAQWGCKNSLFSFI